MRMIVHRALLSSGCLKVTAFIIGFLLWNIMSEYHSAYMTLDVPLSFYNAENYTISAPEHVTVTFGAKRSELRRLDLSQTAVHIDARTLKKGINRLDISHKNLLLPHSINLINYKPVQLTLQQL